MRGIIVLAIVATLAACGQQGSLPAGVSLPAGAIETGPDIYMVPLEIRDADGCQGYRQYSPKHLVTMAIYYRASASDGDGGFTANKLQAACYAKN